MSQNGPLSEGIRKGVCAGDDRWYNRSTDGKTTKKVPNELVRSTLLWIEAVHQLPYWRNVSNWRPRGHSNCPVMVQILIFMAKFPYCYCKSAYGCRHMHPTTAYMRYPFWWINRREQWQGQYMTTAKCVIQVNLHRTKKNSKAISL